ncbi:MAG TPA: cation:proton antiporter [Solirubrobacterales bacterium]|nr:cation:proton antiporter [Solirubrobacterales bacterium]
MPDALSPALAAVSLKSPSGATWEFLILFLVVIVGPPLMTRARIPGIIGLLVGGFVIGPYGLNLIGAGNTTVPDLGQLGLLYLMFVAGVELDLALVRIHRRAVLVYGVLTFALPMLFGTVIGLALGWVPAAALLLGALLSSHTLLLYPTARAAGLAADRGVATAVGATVLTDTAALVVLAAVSGTQVAGGSPASIAAQIVLGLAVLVVFTLFLLPRLARLAFRYLGTDRVVRYLLAVASFLAAGTVADIFGIEPIVGAFFAGLALNRLVPNEGPLMDRIDFFGSAVFVPIFLVSVGLLLDPKVMVEGETLKLAGLFIVASLAGKAASAGIARLALGYSGPQATLMLGLTVPQAAATLAATIVGFNIGLFDQSVVNAALVLILVSIVVGTLLVDRAVPIVPTPEAVGQRLGARVLVVLTDSAQAELAFALAARIAAADGGVVRGLLAAPRGTEAELEPRLAELLAAGYATGVDPEPRLLVHHALAEGVVNVATEQRASLVVLGASRAAEATPFGSDAEAIAGGLAVPVAILLGTDPALREVEVVREADGRAGGAFDADGLAIDLGRRIAGAAVEAGDLGPAGLEPPRPGVLRIMPATSWQLLAGTAEPRPRSAVLLIPDL